MKMENIFLTIEELRLLDGKPVYDTLYKRYGIVFQGYNDCKIGFIHDFGHLSASDLEEGRYKKYE